MTLKSLLERTLPGLASAYRQVRDQRQAAAWRPQRTPLGLEMVGVEGIAESRLGSGEIPLLLERLQPDSVFVDVGANCGVFTLAASTVGASCLAIEPNAHNLAALLENVRRNDLTNVEVFPVALSSAPGVLPLFGGGEGASLERNWGGMLHTYKNFVPVNTLDNIVGDRFVGRELVVKIDVEGHEMQVMQGAAKLLARDPAPQWLLEHGFRENFGSQINPNFEGLFELFWDHGYQAVTADTESRPVTRSDVQRWLSSGERDFGSLNYLMFK